VDIDHILQVLNEHRADYILIGGVNFLLNHEAELTYDVDVWVADQDENLRQVNIALQALRAEWGRTEHTWAPIPPTHDWLKQQQVFCLTSAFGPLDVFREVKGLEGRYAECKKEAPIRSTPTGINYSSLSDRHMLVCQEALDPKDRKLRRIEILRRSLGLQ